MLLKNYKQQHTGGIRLLSEQVAQECVKMGFLVKVEHENILKGEGTVHLYLQKNAAASLLKLLDSGKMTINSALRTLPQQYALKRNLTTLVAEVGRSNHGDGQAIDVEEYSAWHKRLTGAGWTWPHPTSDPVHYVYPGTDRRSDSIKAFQQLWNRWNPENPLTADGSMGEKTMMALGNSPVDGWRDYTFEELKKAFSGTPNKEMVKNFQRKWNKKFPDAKLVVDGQAGQKTEEAFSKFTP